MRRYLWLTAGLAVVLVALVSLAGVGPPVRARGLMVALELEGGADAELTTTVHRALAERGYVVGRRSGLNVLRLDPSLTIEAEEIDGFLAALEGVLSD
jgi:4-aminobutyrate aminotransferase-like enzyme